ncbi:hypothetical protein CB1_016594001 [Camelus ferus]|nr:hypothetical protein CB1_016594001 [Camelus ferus]
MTRQARCQYLACDSLDLLSRTRSELTRQGTLVPTEPPQITDTGTVASRTVHLQTKTWRGRFFLSVCPAGSCEVEDKRPSRGRGLRRTRTLLLPNPTRPEPTPTDPSVTAHPIYRNSR